MAEMCDDRRTGLNLAAASSWSLFPVGVNGKRPATGFRWRQDSSTDPELWRSWFADPAVNIGLDCGASGLVVVDVDPRAGGVFSIVELGRRELLLPATLEVATRSDGAHFYYRSPGVPLGNTAGRLPGVGDLPGIDLRAVGGYVVYPSSSMDGAAWRFIDAAVPVAAAPSWLREPERATSSRSPASQPTSSPSVVLSGGYAAAALRSEADRVGNAVKGSRNHALNRAAFSLGQLIASTDLTAAQIENVLSEAATRSGLAADDGARQVAQTIASGIRTGERSPRSAAL